MCRESGFQAAAIKKQSRDGYDITVFGCKRALAYKKKTLQVEIKIPKKGGPLLPDQLTKIVYAVFALPCIITMI